MADDLDQSTYFCEQMLEMLDFNVIHLEQLL